jgi:hypothetical protein
MPPPYMNGQGPFVPMQPGMEGGPIYMYHHPHPHMMMQHPPSPPPPMPVAPARGAPEEAAQAGESTAAQAAPASQ